MSTFPTAPAYVPPPPAAFKRPIGVTLLAILNGIGGAFSLVVTVLMIAASVATQGEDRAAGITALVFGVLCGLIAAFQIATAIGLWTLKSYGRVCQMIASAFGLLGIPIGTIISGLILYYLTRPGMKLLFSGRAPADLSVDERLQVERDGSQGAVVAVVLVVALLGGVAMLGIVAAIAIPGLLRARMSANEVSAIGSMRAMVSAQVTWSASHNGEYGEPSCLGNPQGCGDSSAPVYLPPDLASLGQKSGYAFGFVLRPPRMMVMAGAADPRPGTAPAGESGEPPAADVPSDAEVQRQLSQMPGALPPTPVEPQHELVPGGFTYWAVPVTPGSTGTRRFCTNETGVVLEYLSESGWVEPTPNAPACPDGGRPIQ